MQYISNLVLLFSLPLALFAQVNGRVIFPEPESSIKIGNGYNKDGTPIMHSSDSLAMLNYNAIISFHPLDFEPELIVTKANVITQKEQTFIPNVLPVTQGTTVYFLNEDQFFHNVFSLTPNSRFNIGRRPPGNSYGKKINKAGIVRLGCDIHAHMSGTILSLDTPYFLRVNADGRYKIEELPAGRYRVDIFHPLTKKRSTTIELQEGKSLTLDFDLSSKA